MDVESVKNDETANDGKSDEKQDNTDKKTSGEIQRESSADQVKPTENVESATADTQQTTSTTETPLVPDENAATTTKHEEAQNSTPASNETSANTQVTPNGAPAEPQPTNQDVAEYIERIDSLEAKLLYLSKTAAESARKTAASLPSGSADRKLAEKDEKIALLMEEGQKLAGGEAKYRAIIKKLRLQVAENEKQAEELQRTHSKALADAELLRSQASGNAAQERAQAEAKKATEGLQKEITALKKEKATREEATRKLERDLKTKTEQADKADLLAKQLASERSKLKTEEETSAALKSDNEILTEKLRQEGIEWKEKVERAVERGNKVEAELRVELLGMDAKLETMRTQAEEVSSGSGGEAQVKLLRQIETLQSQYASASNNWQGIEASLLAKTASLEAERDEAQRRESEMRKKAREATTRARTMEEELEDIRPTLAKSEQDLSRLNDEVAALRIAAKSAEESLEQVRADLEKEKRTASASANISRKASREFTDSADQRKWIEDVAANKPNSRPDSPLLSVQRTLSSDFMGLPLSGRRGGATSHCDGSDFASRRPSVAPARLNSIPFSPTGTAPAPFSPFESSTELMSPPPIEEDEIVRPASPTQAAQDMISMSTVAAGPSVQLVERMSSAIRRLEAEKVASREEMARVCSQRDEARSDLVGLMKDLEEARVASTRVPELEGQVKDLDQRYQTTLEMLGEKSELVEELRADVQDVKAMYRELVERTVK